MRRFLLLVLVSAALAGCNTTAQQAPGPDTRAVLNTLAAGPAPGLPPTVAAAAIGSPAGPRCYGLDRYGMRVRLPC